MDEVVCRPFERTNGRFTLKGAICLSQEEWADVTPEEEVAMQDARWASWLADVTAASDSITSDNVTSDSAEPEM
jgi:hypothetical protein